MTFNQDYYEILGIDSHATRQVLGHVYKNLQKAYHPDMHPENRAFYTEKIKMINKAFEILGNPQTRADYDNTLAEHDCSNTGNNKSYAEDNQNEQSILDCRRCGKRIEDFEITCSNCGAWLSSSAIGEKSTFSENLRSFVRYDTIKGMGFSMVKSIVDTTTVGYLTIKKNGVKFAKESASMISEHAWQ